MDAIGHWVAARVAIDTENLILLVDLGFLDKGGQFSILGRKTGRYHLPYLGEGHTAKRVSPQNKEKKSRLLKHGPLRRK